MSHATPIKDLDTLPPLNPTIFSTLPRAKNDRRQSAPAALPLPLQTLTPTKQDAPLDLSASVQVFCRFRPSSSAIGGANSHSAGAETADGFTVTDGTVSENDDTGRKFHFDKCFPGTCTQGEVYSSIEHIVTGVMAGFNGTIMSYGQTSSGKTHTMEGKLVANDTLSTEHSASSSSLRGMVPRCVETLFRCIEEADETLEFTIKLSFVEIYCEKIRDLLEPESNNLRIKELPTGELVLAGVTEVYVTEEEEVFAVMQQGKAHRATAPTLMNAESSRSHSLLIMTVTQRDVNTERIVKAKLVLGDLAGSERVKKTMVTGSRLEEAKKINQSLTTLGMVINSLTDGSTHVPYRDSKLTRVLQESLGGNSRTALIVCCAPEQAHTHETISTLRFGERASQIKNVIVKNEELSVNELKSLLDTAHKEIERLAKKVERYEKNPPPAATATPPLRRASSSSPVTTTDDYTSALLAEVDSMGIDGDEVDLLTSETDADRSLPILAKQNTALKTEVKKHIQIQMKSFKIQKEKEKQLRVLQEEFERFKLQAKEEEELTLAEQEPVPSTFELELLKNELALEKEAHAQTMAETTTLAMQQDEVDLLEEELTREKEAHAQTKAESQSLADALTTMAHEHVAQGREERVYSGSQGPIPPAPPVELAKEPAEEPYNADRSFDLYDRISSNDGADPVASPLATKKLLRDELLVSNEMEELRNTIVTLSPFKAENEVLQNELAGLKRALRERTESGEIVEGDLEEMAGKLEEAKKMLKQVEGKVEEASIEGRIKPEKLSQLKGMTSDLQSMINEEIEQLEVELEEAETALTASNKELAKTRDELRVERHSAYEIERDLRKDLGAARKQIESNEEREARALESVEKRRSSRGNFWSPRQRLSERGGGSLDYVDGVIYGSPLGSSGAEGVEDLRLEFETLEKQYHANLDAHALVLETKEEVLRSLLKQNASLTMERSGLTRERDKLTGRIKELTEALIALQQAATVLGGEGGGGGGGLTRSGSGGVMHGGKKKGRLSGSSTPSPVKRMTKDRGEGVSSC